MQTIVEQETREDGAIDRSVPPSAQAGKRVAAPWGFLGLYLTTMRPYLLFVSGIAGIAGLAFVPELGWGTGLAVAFASFLSYGFGQALTDCFQGDTDRLSAPYRPLSRGLIGRRQVLATSVAGLLACAAVFAVLQPMNLVLGAVGVAGLATYTPLKRRWWAGPAYNAWIVALVSLMAFAAGAREPLPPLSGRFVAMLATVFFGYAHFVLAGYAKDVEADAATGYRTFPVTFGRAAGAWAADAIALAAVASALPFGLSGDPRPLGLFLAGAGLLALAGASLHRVLRDADAYRAIVPGLHGFVLLTAAVAAGEKPEWTPFLVLYWAAFAVALARRPERAQI